MSCMYVGFVLMGTVLALFKVVNMKENGRGATTLLLYPMGSNVGDQVISSSREIGSTVGLGPVLMVMVCGSWFTTSPAMIGQ